MGNTILVLGGGSGLVAASRLCKGLSRDHRVVLIEHMQGRIERIDPDAINGYR